MNLQRPRESVIVVPATSLSSISKSLKEERLNNCTLLCTDQNDLRISVSESSQQIQHWTASGAHIYIYISALIFPGLTDVVGM
jgi:hypothetical protein